MQNLNRRANITLLFLTLLEFFHAQDYIADLSLGADRHLC
jgi:hypothetical protein